MLPAAAATDATDTTGLDLGRRSAGDLASRLGASAPSDHRWQGVFADASGGIAGHSGADVDTDDCIGLGGGGGEAGTGVAGGGGQTGACRGDEEDGPPWHGCGGGQGRGSVKVRRCLCRRLGFRAGGEERPAEVGRRLKGAAGRGWGVHPVAVSMDSTQMAENDEHNSVQVWIQIHAVGHGTTACRLRFRSIRGNVGNHHKVPEL
mmetsp:Transcript_99945/g.254242  ORF Transcript_99945/g.254242 Transcript_99945/m.254242 type:complete len:205 (+) Transcript_99945:1086-1700(+)